MSNVEIPTVKRFDAGHVSINGTSVTKSFHFTFLREPTVVITPRQKTTKAMWVTNVTTTGFTLNADGNFTGSFYWIALDF